jgi:hypothetical protein
MIKGRRKAEWARAGTIAAAIYNVNRGRNRRVIRPSDFYRELEQPIANWKATVQKFKDLEKKK